ncbi:MAG: DUF971 domain-containing protein [Hyphomicrobium aestuarii]|nr:DUF971 domain-containing protein [Hyphomicrobium aestuarii]
MAWPEAEGLRLAVRLPSDRTVVLAATLLWNECPSAAGRRRRMLPDPPRPVGDLKITSVRPIGHYGVNIVFSDGHDRGIFPWVFLQGLAARPTIDDFISDEI